MHMTKRWAIAVVATLLALMPVTAAQADLLNLDASASGSISFTGMPPSSLGVSISNLTGTGRLLGDVNTGLYTLLAPAAPFTAGPAVGGVFPIPSVAEPFVYVAADGALAGSVTWDALA